MLPDELARLLKISDPERIAQLKPMTDPIHIARIAGTLDQIDRSKQYGRATPEELLRSLNEAWTKIRLSERAIASRDKTISDLHKKVSRYRFVNIALTSILTAAAVEGVKALVAVFFP